MKINIGPIIGDHLRSLRNENDQSRSYIDYFIFFVIPILCGVYSYRENFRLDRESYNASITFFGIFVALLLNIQMAIFSIYQRKWNRDLESIYVDNDRADVEIRRRLLEQLNSNISYLIIVCCITLVLVLSSYIRSTSNLVVAALTVVLYAHFILTMLMVVKRSHSLFQREYQETDS